MKSILTILFLLIYSVTFGQGGGKQGPPQIPSDTQVEKMVTNFAKKASLTSDQESKMLVVSKSHFSEMRSKTSGDSKPDRDEMEALKESFKSDIEAILTDDQMKIFEAQMKKKKGNRQKK